MFKTDEGEDNDAKNAQLDKSADSLDDQDGLVDNFAAKKEGENGEGTGAQEYQKAPDQEEDDDEEQPDQFDSLVPDNWEALADMRLRQLDKEYDKCVKFDIKEDGEDY